MRRDGPPTESDDPAGEANVEVVVPQLGESVTEAMILEWLVRPGDFVERAQPIAYLGLDKIDIELESPAAGVVELQQTREATVKIGEVVARIVPPPPADRARVDRHDELLAAIATAPDDDGARQVYADFLLETTCALHPWGAETVALRGEYLSVVARIARPQPDDDVRALAQRRDELAKVARVTAISLVPVAGEHLVEHGFVVGFQTSLATLVESHAAIFARSPIRALAIGNLGPRAGDRLLALPRLEQLRELTLLADGVGKTPSGMLRAIASPRLAAVRRLELRQFELGPADGAALAAMSTPILELRDCLPSGMAAALGDRAFERLAITSTEDWPSDELAVVIARPLHELALSGSGAPPPLAGTRGLAVLELAGYRIAADWTLAPTQLARLHLRCAFGGSDPLLAMIARLPPTLAVLELGGATVGEDVVADFAAEITALTPARVVF